MALSQACTRIVGHFETIDTSRHVGDLTWSKLSRIRFAAAYTSRSTSLVILAEEASSTAVAYIPAEANENVVAGGCQEKSMRCAGISDSCLNSPPSTRMVKGNPENQTVAERAEGDIPNGQAFSDAVKRTIAQELIHNQAIESSLKSVKVSFEGLDGGNRKIVVRRALGS